MAAPAQNISDTPQAGALTLGELARTIKRNGWAFWLTLFVGLGIGAVATALQPAAYQVGTKLLIEGGGRQGGAASPDLAIGEVTIPGASYTAGTQVELLQSFEIQQEVWLASGIQLSNNMTQEQIEALPKTRVFQDAESNVYTLLVEGTRQPELEEVARNYPTIFGDYILNLKRAKITQAINFVNSRIDEEQTLLDEAENELAAFKSNNRIVDSGAELNRRIAETASAETQETEALQAFYQAQAAVRKLVDEIGKVPATKETKTEATNNATLLENQAILARLEVGRASLSQTYTDDSVQMKELDAQIQKQKEHIESLEQNLVSTVVQTNPRVEELQGQLINARINLDAAQARLNQIQAIATERESRLNDLGSLVPAQRALEQRIARHTETVDQLSRLRNQFELRNNEITSGIQGLTPDRFIEADQIRPNVTINMALAGLLSLALAFVVALTRDSLKDRVNSVEEAYALSGLDVMSRIPERPGGRNQLISDPQSSVAFESYRVLRSLIGLLNNQAPINSLVITSTGRGEGKTVVSSNLAVAFALNGQKTVLVDANFRDPAVHGMFGKPMTPGLGEVLSGNAQIEDVLVDTDVANLKVLPAGTHPDNATEALGSARMKAIIDHLNETSDMVLFDSSATLGIADAPSIASLTDASLLVVQTGKIGRDELSDAVGILKASSPRVLGMVFNRVKAKQARLENA